MKYFIRPESQATRTVGAHFVCGKRNFVWSQEEI
jgi:hypothetical protein